MGAEMTRRFTARRCRRLLRSPVHHVAEQHHNLASTSVLRILPHPTLDEQVLSLARYARATVGHNRWRA